MRLHPGSRSGVRGRGTQAGHTLIEVMIAISVLLMAVLVYSQSVTSGIRSQQAINEKSVALNAARDVLERMKSEPFDQVYATFSAGPEQNFQVDGLDPQPGQNFEGVIVFPEVGGALREDQDLPEFGLPYDLNADGVIDGSDVSGDYRLLPVIVRIEWDGASGEQQLEVATWLADGI